MERADSLGLLLNEIDPYAVPPDRIILPSIPHYNPFITPIFTNSNATSP